MARIEVEDAQAWAEKTKLPMVTLEPNLVSQIEGQVLDRLSGGFDTSTWLDSTTTPPIIKSVIAMFYVSWVYDKQYSEEQQQLNDYAVLLRAQAESLMVGILDGSTAVPGLPVPTTGGPAFYPTDASSLTQPTDLDRSLGAVKFSMNLVF